MSPKGVLMALAGIVFVSGFCSLAYQVVWLREFRLIFGGAAPAASAVLAVFMGGLGLGGLYLGKRVEATEYPGRWYAGIEGAITLATLLSPLLLALIRKGYTLTGGVQTLGLPLATGVQILMTAIVIGPACFMMGGTLPAALRVVQSNDDGRRMTTALFYGVNVAGAVIGAVLATFVWLPGMGNLWTLLYACAANAVITVLAFGLLGKRRRFASAPDQAEEEPKKGRLAEVKFEIPGWYISGVAFVSGFAFFLIELVWYRASIPLFGGSVYNFGLILAVALAGIGSGSLFYSLSLRRIPPSLGLFALVSSLLAFCIIVPFAMGDRLAQVALLLNGFFMPRSFEGLVFGWSCICVVLVFLPAFFAGIQFPFLISLIGKGGREIGAQLGRVYAWNTLGAVSGALLGGFIMMPVMTITVSWRAAAIIALLISCVTLFWHSGNKKADRNAKGGRAAVLSFGLCCMTFLVSLLAAGPSAYWLHHPIGYGRANPMYGASESAWINYSNEVKRSLLAAEDGRETSVAVTCTDDYAILSNGKSDSAAISDSKTTIMSGLVGAILHPSEVKTACVVGFGTGITAGWMEKVDSIKQLDIIELESAIIDLGRYFTLTNFDVTKSKKVKLLEGDAREILVTSPQRYDLIVSEPSNLHRAGVANLYTQEFYQSVIGRLNRDGIFCQWVPTYETDAESVQLVIATLSSVFPKIELWQAGGGDLLLVCSREDKPWQLAKVRERLNLAPFKTGVRNLWGTVTLEGFFSRAVANADFARSVAKGTKLLNTDDLNHLEFWFARNLGIRSTPVMPVFMERANSRGELLPAFDGDGIAFDWEQWAIEYAWKGEAMNSDVVLPDPIAGQKAWSNEVARQFHFAQSMPRMNAADLVRYWPLPARTEISRLTWLSALANAPDSRFESEIEAVRETWPLEYHILRAEYEGNSGRPMNAFKEYFNAVRLSKKHPIIRKGFHKVMWVGIEKMIKRVEFTSREELAGYFELAAKPSAFAGLTDEQRRVMVSLSMPLGLDYQVRAAEAWGRYPEWSEQVLRFQRDVYKRAKHRDYRLAERNLEKWMKMEKRGTALGTTQ